MKIFNWPLEHPHWITSGLFLLVLLSGWALKHLNLDAVPDITPVQVVINGKTQGLDPEKIELWVTRPVEIAMQGLPRLQEIRSLSKYGLSQVTLIFEEDVHLIEARQQVMERLQNIRHTLPQKMSIELAPSTTGLGEVLMYALRVRSGSLLSQQSILHQLTYLRTVQDFLIRPELKKISGVAEVDSNGGYQKEIHIHFFPDLLEKFGYTLEHLLQKLESLGETQGAGFIQMVPPTQQNIQQILVRTGLGWQEESDVVEQLEKLPLGLSMKGQWVSLKEVAQVQIGSAVRMGAATLNAIETVLGTVLMRTGENSHRVAQAAEETLKKILLPDDVEVIQLYSRSFLVQETLKSVLKNLIEGALAVCVTLFLFLGNLKASFCVAFAIPLSMCFAICGMFVFGISGNLMSLGAIDFGLLVDGAVVIVDQILRRCSSVTKTQKIDSHFILESMEHIMPPVLFGLLVIMSVYIPLLGLGGIEGKTFRPMVMTVLLALLGSLGVTLFVIPLLSHRFLVPDLKRDHLIQSSETWILRKLRQAYLPLLRASLQYPKRCLLIGVMAMLGSFGCWFNLGSDFLPSLDEWDVVINLERDARITLTQSLQEQQKAESLLKHYQEVETVFSRMGTTDAATDPMGVYLSDTFLILKKNRSDWHYPNKESLIAAIQSDLLKLDPPPSVNITQPIQMRFYEILEGSRADVTLRLFGLDLQKLMHTIDQLQPLLKQISGVRSVTLDPLTSLKQSTLLDWIWDPLILARYDVNLAQLNHLVETALVGSSVGTRWEGGIPIPIVLKLAEDWRNTQSGIAQLPVSLPQGGILPLGTFGQAIFHDRVTTIARSWGERYASLSIDLLGRDLESFVQEAQDEVQKSMILPADIRLFWGGQYQHLQQAKQKLSLILVATVALVFFLVFQSVRRISWTFWILMTLPMATLGGALALKLRGIAWSVSAAVGFMALMGIALLNTLVLVHVYLQAQKTQPYLTLQELILESTVSRLRPVLMTAFVASIGFLPMALNTGLGCEVQRPLATVVMGGILTSTLFTLLILPALFQLILVHQNKMKGEII